MLKVNSYYKYLELNPRTGQRSKGVISRFDDFKENEYLSYRNERNNLVLISNLESIEYKCRGSCYCDKLTNIDKRRSLSSSKPLIRGLIQLVAAGSLTLAIQSATKHFSEICQSHQLTDEDMECEDAHLRPEIEDCEEITYPHAEKEKNLESMTYMDHGIRTTIYKCSAHCLPNVYDHYEPLDEDLESQLPDINLDEKGKKMARAYGCEKMIFETEIWHDPRRDWFYPPDDEREIPKFRKHYVEDKFIEDFLEQYCMTNSVVDMKKQFPEDYEDDEDDHYDALYDDNDLEENPFKDYSHYKPMCVHHDNDFDYPKNPSLECTIMKMKTLQFRKQVGKDSGKKKTVKSMFDDYDFGEDEDEDENR